MQPKKRGGKRPGAGAPKGNFNGVRTGNHSKRLLMVYVAVHAHPDPKALVNELYDAGFIRPGTHRLNGDVRGVVAYLYKRWFDSAGGIQSSPINCNQAHSEYRPPLRAEKPPADTNHHEDIPPQQ